MFDQLAIFDGLMPRDARDIVDACQRRDAAPGRAFFQQDDEARGLYVLAAGQAKLSRASVDGRHIVVQLVRPGEPLDCALGSETRHATSAVAVLPSTALIWSADDLRRLAARHPTFAVNVLTAIRQQLADTQERVGELATARAEQRVALALLRFAALARTKAGNPARIELPVSREDVAQMAGTTLYTVSRLLSGWERRGLLSLGRQLVVILRISEIETLAHGA